jgi:hypothetical protein
MDRRPADADSIDDVRFRPASIRPLVLLALDNPALRARFAYQLMASGFDVVVTDGAADPRYAARAAVIVTESAATRLAHSSFVCRRRASARRTAGLKAGRYTDIETALDGSLLVGSASDDGRRLRSIPVIAVADDVGDSTRDLARREGCAAVCLTTCSGASLAAGIRAVLDR